MPKRFRKTRIPWLYCRIWADQNQNRRFLQRKRNFERRADFILITEKLSATKKSLCKLRSFAQGSESGRTDNASRRKKKLEITSIKGNEVVCKVIIGGEVKGKRGVNLPGTKLSISSLTAKDKRFGVWDKNKVDFVAFSFVRRPDDVSELGIF